jgi:porin
MKMLKRIFVACAFLLALATYAQENQPTATMQSTQTQATQQMQSTAQPQAQTAQTNAQAQTNQTTQTATQSAEQQNPQGVIQTVVEETEVSVEGVAVQCTCPNCKKVCPQDKASCPKAKSCTPCDKAKKCPRKCCPKDASQQKDCPKKPCCKKPCQQSACPPQANCGCPFMQGNFGFDYVCDGIAKGQNDLYQKTGVKLTFDYYADVYSNPSGGERQGTNYTHIMIFGADVDFEKMLGIKGASMRISGAYNTGKDLSKKIGNYFTISQSAVTGGWMFYELYYSQKLELPWDDTLVITAGRMSMSDSFASLPVFGYLGSGSMDSVPESIFFASPFTASTIATWGMVADYQTSNNLTFSYGLFQAPPNENKPDWNGTDFGIGSEDGYMMLMQVKWSPTFAGNLQGEYMVGGYFFDGYDMARLRNGASFKDEGFGFYVQGQQMVWVDKNDSNRNITVWAGMQYSPTKTISAITYQPYAGVQFSGFIPCRPDDAIFVSWTSGFFSSDYNNNQSNCETVFEVNYLFQVNQYVSLQPVMQFVLNPNGQSDIDNAVVLGGQIMVSF